MKSNKGVSWLKDLDMYIAVIMLAALIVLTLVNVITRRFFNHPFSWNEEVQLALIIWVICFGGSAAFKTGSHVAVEMLVELLPKKTQRLLEILVYVVVMATLFYLLRTSVGYCRQLLDTNRVTNILKIPQAFIYLAMPISCVLMMIRLSMFTWLRDRSGKEHAS